MKEATLLKLALAVSIIGISILFFMSRQIKVDEAMISRLDELVDDSVVVEGTVVGVNQGEGVVFLKLQKDEMVDVVLFGEMRPVSEGDYVQVRGKVSSESGSESVIGEELRVI